MICADTVPGLGSHQVYLEQLLREPVSCVHHTAPAPGAGPDGGLHGYSQAE